MMGWDADSRRRNGGSNVWEDVNQNSSKVDEDMYLGDQSDWDEMMNYDYDDYAHQNWDEDWVGADNKDEGAFSAWF
eukprot:597279-Rhodomonas_salina.1